MTGVFIIIENVFLPVCKMFRSIFDRGQHFTNVDSICFKFNNDLDASHY